MDMGNKSGLTVPNMMVSGEWTKLMAMAVWFTQMEISTRANGKTTKRMVTAAILMPMVLPM